LGPLSCLLRHLGNPLLDAGEFLFELRDGVVGRLAAPRITLVQRARDSLAQLLAGLRGKQQRDHDANGQPADRCEPDLEHLALLGVLLGLFTVINASLWHWNLSSDQPCTRIKRGMEPAGGGYRAATRTSMPPS